MLVYRQFNNIGWEGSVGKWRIGIHPYHVTSRINDCHWYVAPSIRVLEVPIGTARLQEGAVQTIYRNS